MTTLLDTIRSVAAKARKYSDGRLGEQNTKASLIEPMLEALGWDIREPEEVHREFRPTGKDSPVDYALKIMREPRLFLEAKGLGETLGDRKWIAQVLGYATVAGVEWCVLTDGDEYRFYNATAPIDAEEKMFWRVRLTESGEQEAERALSLMSRNNLDQNLLEVLWKSHFVDRRVKAALSEMLATPDPVIVRRLRQRVPKLKAKEVTDSLRRLEIRVEAPAVLPEVRKAAPVAPRAGGSPSRQARRGSGGAATAVALSDIIGAGVITPPLRLLCRYKGHDLEATVLPSGEVAFQGTTYATCSGAAEAARATVTGRKMKTNGWIFWKYADPSGQPRELDALRRECAAGEKPKLRLTARPA